MQPFIIADQAVALKIVALGYGYHTTQIAPENLEEILQKVFASYLLCSIPIALPKYSVLFFYVRLFSTRTQSFRFGLYTCGILQTIIFLFVCAMEIFGCEPIRKSWLPMVPGHCVSHYREWLSVAVISVFIDILILILPLPKIWKLHAGKSRKLVLIGTLFCGYW